MSSSKRIRSSGFVPSPQWLSESPARLPSSTASGTSAAQRRTPRGSPGRFEGLVSPIPPPPANLFPEPQAAFNVDPGVPFLATEGDSERASEKEGSQKEERFVGGFVSGIKSTVRRSLRRRHHPREPEFVEPEFVDQDEFQDSGYSSALASVPAPLPQGRRPSTTEAVTSHEGITPIEVYRPSPVHPVRQDSLHPRRPSTTEVMVSHEGYPEGYDPVLGLGRLSVLTESQSSMEIPRTSDYLEMRLLQSDVSFSTYIQRFKRLVQHIASLPFSNRYRVTYDYHPESDLRDDPRRLPFIVWQRPEWPIDESSSRGHGEANIEPAVIPTAGHHVHAIDPAPAMVIRTEGPPPVSHPIPPRPPPQQIPQQEPLVRPAAFNAPTFVQPAPSLPNPSPWHTSTVDPTWFEAFHVPRPPSSAKAADKRWRAATPYHGPVPITAETPRREWQPHANYRRGYVPPELAEGHYGVTYGPGIHSARAGLVPLNSGPPSSASAKGPVSSR